MVCLVKTFYTHRMEAIQLQICKCEWFLCDNINNDNAHNGGGGRSEHTKDQVTSDVE